jgi:glycosyltransferase involved in cell wall biosynthesis
MHFSVITVTLNSEKTILRTIKSINNQIFKKFEYIIIDGSSIDSTLHIIKKNLNHKKILVSEKDNGIYSAMNKGILIARGKYIVFLNSDDWLNNNTLHNVFNFIKNNNYPDIIYGNARFYNNKKFIFESKANLSNIKFNMSLLHSSVYIKKDIIKKFLFSEKYLISSDYDQILQLYKKYKFYYYNKSLSNISLGGASSNILISSKEFFIIQIKYNGIIYGSLNFLIRYHYRLFHIFFLIIKNFFKKNNLIS